MGDAPSEATLGICVCVDDAAGGEGCCMQQQQQPEASWMLFLFQPMSPRSSALFPSVPLVHLNCRSRPQPPISHASLHHTPPCLSLFVHYTPT